MSLKEELTKLWNLTELKKFASELKIPNRSKMNKEQLIDAINVKIQEV